MDQRRNPVQVGTVVSGSAMLVARHSVFVLVRSALYEVCAMRDSKGGLVVHRAVAQRPDDRLRRRDRGQDEQRGADGSAQSPWGHTKGRNLPCGGPARQRGLRVLRLTHHPTATACPPAGRASRSRPPCGERGTRYTVVKLNVMPYIPFDPLHPGPIMPESPIMPPPIMVGVAQAPPI